MKSMKPLHIGLIREEKKPADSRVPIIPSQARFILDNFPHISITVEPSEVRCYSDDEYRAAGVNLSSDLSDCDIIMAVKEIPKEKFIANKQYYFFSHTIKKQPYNRDMLLTILEKSIDLVDYECLRNPNGQRIIGFGRFAGIVGAHNALRAYGLRHKIFELPAAHLRRDFDALKAIYAKTKWPAIKIVNTGNGKVAKGASETLREAGIREVSASDFVQKQFDEAVFTHLQYNEMYRHCENGEFDKRDFYANPSQYQCDFQPFYQVAEIFINGIYWDPEGPKYFTLEEMNNDDFKIEVIADVTCDIAPESSVPSTIRSTKIGDDLMGFDPTAGTETELFSDGSITLMSVDNLPNELPRDASESFGISIIESLIPEMLKEQSSIIDNATIASKGALNEKYQYLSDYVQEQDFVG